MSKYADDETLAYLKQLEEENSALLVAIEAKDAMLKRIAAGHSQFGTVTFIRNKVGRQWWHELPEEQQEITPLYMYGKGTTVIEAMHHAAMKGATE